jgi:hypothetical protein
VEADCQKPMPDSAESVPFWSSVATAFKGNDAVIFDLFNEHLNLFPYLLHFC